MQQQPGREKSFPSPRQPLPPPCHCERSCAPGVPFELLSPSPQSQLCTLFNLMEQFPVSVMAPDESHIEASGLPGRGDGIKLKRVPAGSAKGKRGGSRWRALVS